MSVSAHTPGTTAETLPFDPWVLLVTLRRRLWWVVGGGLFGFALAATVAALLLRATWEARTVLVRHEQNMARNTDMPYLHQELSVNTVLETVKLRRNLEEVIERLKLPTTPERLFPRIRVRKGNKSNVFQILVVDGDRDRAVAIANTMAEVFTGSFTRVQNAAAEKMYAYYVGQRDDAREKLAAAMADGQRFREERGLLSIEKEAAATFEELTAVEIRHLDNEMQQTELETRIRVNEDFIASLPETEVLARTVNVAKAGELEAELRALREKYTDNNPKILALEQAVEAMRKRSAAAGGAEGADQITYGGNALRDALRTETAQLRSELAASRSKHEHFERQIAALRDKVRSLTQAEQEFFEMQRSSDLYREALNTIEHRLLEARAAMDSSISDFQILEPASPPNYPLGTGRRKFALAGGVLGAMLPLLFFGGIELLDRRTKSALDLARLTRGGVTVTLPEAPGEMEQLLSPRLQVLYDRVMNAAGPPPAQRRVVVVVGEPDGIGRRFIARRLALLARAAGLQPCVVAPAEADEVPDVPLINDFLLARDGLEALVPLRSAEGVDELRIRADERLLSTPVGRPRIRAVFEHLGAHATPVFLLALGSDFSPQLLADMVAEADQTLVVCGFRRTPLETLRRMIEAAGPGMSVAPVLVLNRIDKEYYRA